jgi:hypothetical protein
MERRTTMQRVCHACQREPRMGKGQQLLAMTGKSCRLGAQPAQRRRHHAASAANGHNKAEFSRLTSTRHENTAFRIRTGPA